MSTPKSLLVMAAAALLAVTGSANANIVVFTDQAAFIALLQPGFYLEDFENENPGTLSGPHTFTNVTHSFRADAPSDLFITTDVIPAGKALSHRNDFPLTLDNFSAPGAVTAIGGFFFPNNTNASLFDMDVTASNGIDTTTITLENPIAADTFLGFFSTGPAFTSLVADIIGVAGPPNADTNDFIVGTAVPEPTTVLIDIKPGSFPNSVNLKSNGVLPVAILGTDEFNVNEVDISTLLFGDPNSGTPLSPVRSAFEDVSDDGFEDLSLKFSVADLMESGVLGPDTIEGFLRGELLDGTSFEGMDSIRIVPPSFSSAPLIAAVPEPSTLALTALGLLGIGWRRRKAGVVPSRTIPSRRATPGGFFCVCPSRTLLGNG